MSKRFFKNTDIYMTHRTAPAQPYMSADFQHITPHFHFQDEFLLTISGTAQLSVAGKVYTLDAGSILCISNLENHFILSHSDDYDRYTIRFSNEALTTLIYDPLLLSIFKQRPLGFSHLYKCSQQETTQFVHMLEIMLREYKEEKAYWYYLIASKMRDILVYMYRGNPNLFPGQRKQAKQTLVFDVQNYIQSHLDENLNLEDISNRFFISKYHLSHSFSNVTGYTFKHYIVMARLSKAKDLLLHTDQEIQLISSNVGFASPSHFIRIFKANEGLSPLQYRNRAKKQK